MSKPKLCQGPKTLEERDPPAGEGPPVFRGERLRREIIGAAARKLRSRVTAIEGGLPLLRPVIDEDTEEAGVLNELEKNCQALCELVDELVEFADMEIQAAKGAAVRVPVPPRDLVRRAIGAVAEVARPRRVLLLDRVPGDLPPLRAEPAQLTRALAHLLARMIKCSPDGAVVTVEAMSEEEGLRIRFSSDEGPGISAADLDVGPAPHLTDPPSRGPEGGGLGLLIARQIVEEHGGDLQVASPSRERARGFCLSVLLPTDNLGTAP